ncbi:MAG TPA: PorV/PorQ family protein [bacterium]|nr:PorV/PorQ family protein [bacterium]
MKLRKFAHIILLLTFICWHPSPSSGALKKLGQTGLKFLDVGMGARPAAMGEAYALLGDDANAMFYNPAGIVKMRSTVDLTVTHTAWIADITYNAAALVLNMEEWGNFGLSAISPDYGTIVGTQIADNNQGYVETGNIDAGAFALGLAYARQLTNKFTIGAHFKYASQNLGAVQLEEGGERVENTVSGLAYDLGTMFYPRFSGWESFGFGMSIKNFSSQFKYAETPFQLPLTFSLGFAGNLLELIGVAPEVQALNFEVDALHPRDYTERLHVGAEYSWKNMVSLRSGYKFNYDEEGLSFGIGLNVYGIGVDYAYSDFGTFNFVNRISVSMAY